MIKINQIKIKDTIKEDEIHGVLEEIILNTLKISKSELIHWYIEKKSIDARKKPIIFYIYAVGVEVRNEDVLMKRLSKSKTKLTNIQPFSPNKYEYPLPGTKELSSPPVVVGSGPAGLFCALELAKKGFNPILIERGAEVDQRVQDVNLFWETGTLNPNSNVQFGEGGAGTFSDGKLNTGVKDPMGRNRKVLETFVEHGAPESILYESKPHIGTDILIHIVKSMRKEIIKHGGKVYFHSQLTKLIIQENQLKAIEINHQQLIETSIVVLAIGHSARDTFTYLDTYHSSEIPMEEKAFAIGLRAEHSQDIINQSQYGKEYSKSLPPSPYKVVTNLTNGRGVYSFCMCPGGYVVNASSENGLLAVNGMSYSHRNSPNANSAIVVTVTPEDCKREMEIENNFKNGSPLNGMYFQQELEKRAFDLCKGDVPVQLYRDFCTNTKTTELKSMKPQIKGTYSFANLRQILPEFLAQSIQLGIQEFGKKIKGFDHPDVILTGVETRTSSPLRILRNSDLESLVTGVYPCGEGAGYAGGITSAAMDGVKVFESIYKGYKSTQ